MISEKQHEEIRKEAKRLLDNFARSLSSVKIEEKELKSEVGGFREEKDPQCPPDFRERMFENAPEKKGDSIIAEKKW